MRVLLTQLADPVPLPSAVTRNIAATAGGQAGARELTARVNIVETCSPGMGVRLKVIAGEQQQVMNRSPSDLLIFPQTGAGIEDAWLNIAVVIPPGGNATFTWDGVDTWRQT